MLFFSGLDIASTDGQIQSEYLRLPLLWPDRPWVKYLDHYEWIAGNLDGVVPSHTNFASTNLFGDMLFSIRHNPPWLGFIYPLPISSTLSSSSFCPTLCNEIARIYRPPPRLWPPALVFLVRPLASCGIRAAPVYDCAKVICHIRGREDFMHRGMIMMSSCIKPQKSNVTKRRMKRRMIEIVLETWGTCWPPDRNYAHYGEAEMHDFRGVMVGRSVIF